MEQKYVTDKQGNKVLPITHIDAVRDSEGNTLTSLMGTFEDEVRGLVDTPHQNYVTVAATSSTTAATDVLPASGQSADTIYRVSNWDGSANSGAGAFSAASYSEYAWDDVSDPNKYIFLCVKSQIGEVFNISVYNNNAKYADLASALGTNGANVPESLRKGGMSVKFVQSSDNKYVQFRYMGTAVTGNPSPFLDTANWQGVDDEPVAGSKNLVESRGVYDKVIQNKSRLNVIQVNGGNPSASSDALLGFPFEVSKTYSLTYISSTAGYTASINVYKADGSATSGLLGNIKKVPELFFTSTADYPIPRITTYGACEYVIGVREVGIVDDVELNNAQTMHCQEVLGEYTTFLYGENMSSGITSSMAFPIVSGETYTLWTDDELNGNINFYTTEVKSASTKVGVIGPSKKSFTFESNVTQDYLYIDLYASRKKYTIHYKIASEINVKDAVSQLQSSVRTLGEEISAIEIENNIHRIIYDTDFPSDIDDLTEPTILAWGARSGSINVIGCNCSYPRLGKNARGNTDCIKALSAELNYYGLTDIPLGMNYGMRYEKSKYATSLQEYQAEADSFIYAYDSVEFYRRVLSNIPEGGKTDIMVGGPMFSISDLLNSPADGISSLTGLQLVEQKVDTIWAVGGSYPNGGKEWNFSGNGGKPFIDATYNVLTNCPVRMVFLGADQSGVHIGDILYDEHMDWLLTYKAMNEFMTEVQAEFPTTYPTVEDAWKARSYAWGALCCLLAVDSNPSITGYNIVRGTNSINNDSTSADYGKNTFTPNTTGNHYYASKQQGRNNDWFTKRNDSIVVEKNWPSHIKPCNKYPVKTGTKHSIEYDVVVSNTSSALVLTDINNVTHQILKGHAYYITTNDERTTNINFYTNSNMWNDMSCYRGRLSPDNDLVVFYTNTNSSNMWVLNNYTNGITLHIKEEWVE